MNALEQYWNDLNREEADHEQIKNIVDDIELFVPALCLTAGRDYAGLPRDVAAHGGFTEESAVSASFPMRVRGCGLR